MVFKVLCPPDDKTYNPFGRILEIPKSLNRPPPPPFGHGKSTGCWLGDGFTAWQVQFWCNSVHSFSAPLSYSWHVKMRQRLHSPAGLDHTVSHACGSLWPAITCKVYNQVCHHEDFLCQQRSLENERWFPEPVTGHRTEGRQEHSECCSKSR